MQRQFFEHKLEMMDQPEADMTMLKDDLRNLRVINKYFGGLAALRRGITPLLRKSGTAITILDLATGSGDQPVALAKTLRGMKKDALITAVDRNDVMLDVARKYAAGFKEITFQKGDILQLPYQDKSFDIVTCSLAIHHFSRDNAISLLREMYRMSRIGFVLNDLSRSYVGAVTAWVYTRLTTMNPMTKYDSVVSVLRAFTKDELASMADDAGVSPLTIFTAPMFRLVAVKEK